MAEAIDTRIFAALQLVDAATGQLIYSPIQVESENASLFRNKSGLFIINGLQGIDLAGIDAYPGSFETPVMPAIGAVSVAVSCNDPSRTYLARTVSVSLPRDADPSNADNTNSIFNPLLIELYRDVHAKTLLSWSLVRVIAEQGGNAVAGAFIQVVRNSDDQLLGRGVTNPQGEALVIIPGIPITEFSEGDEDDDDDDDEGSDEEQAVVIQDINVRVEISLAAEPEWPVNPDALQANHAGNVADTQNTSLRTGRTEIVRFVLPE